MWEEVHLSMEAGMAKYMKAYRLDTTGSHDQIVWASRETEQAFWRRGVLLGQRLQGPLGMLTLAFGW